MNSPGISPEKEFFLHNLAEWKSFLTELFHDNIPQSKTWKDRAEIIYILDKIGAQDHITHLFFPHGGGLDLTGANVSYEMNCIELHFDELVYIVKPDHLAFESFGDDYELAYFRLETCKLRPSGVYDRAPSVCEYLTEISPGKYADRGVWAQGFIGYDDIGDEVPLTSEARPVGRIFSGSLVVFAKGSAYNRSPETYDAIHNEVTESEFREQVKAAAEYKKAHRTIGNVRNHESLPFITRQIISEN